MVCKLVECLLMGLYPDVGEGLACVQLLFKKVRAVVTSGSGNVYSGEGVFSLCVPHFLLKCSIV